MQVWNVLHAAHWKYRTQKSRQKSPFGHHRTTSSGYIFATKARIDNRKKKHVKQQYLLHMPSEYGELRPTNGWDWLTSLGHPSKFQLVSHLGSATYIRQGDHHVGHWPTFLVYDLLYTKYCIAINKSPLVSLLETNQTSYREMAFLPLNYGCQNDEKPNTNCTQAAERAEKCCFLSLVTLTFKLIRATNQTCFPCKFRAYPFRGSPRYFIHKQKSTNWQRQKQNLPQFTACSKIISSECRHKYTRTIKLFPYNCAQRVSHSQLGFSKLALIYPS